MRRLGHRERKAGSHEWSRTFAYGARAGPAACREGKGPAACDAQRAPLIILPRTSKRERASSRAKLIREYVRESARKTKCDPERSHGELARLRGREGSC